MSLFSTTDLATDADLTATESRMPKLAKQVTGDNGQTAFDGKRLLAKEFIAKYLRKKGIHPDGLLTPLQLTRAAVLKELELIYRDLAAKNDTVAMDKSKYYRSQFEEEMEDLPLDYDPSVVPIQPPQVEASVSWFRAGRA